MNNNKIKKHALDNKSNLEEEKIKAWMKSNVKDNKIKKQISCNNIREMNNNK